VSQARNRGLRQVPVVDPQAPFVAGLLIEYGLMGVPLGWTFSGGPPG
jgi:hypothetical protein